MSNQEKVARLLYDLDGEGCEQSDLIPWQREMAPVRDKYLCEATAAIDALADVDGIAGVLDAHEDSTGSMNECSCGQWGSFDVNWHVRLKSFNQHQAAAVVAWMKDRT